MSFIPFSCVFCAACIPIRSWYSFQLHLNTKRHSRKSLGDRNYFARYLEYFKVDRRKFDDMTDHLSIEQTGALMYKFQTKLLEIVTKSYADLKAAPRLGSDPVDSYHLVCLACNKEFNTFNEGMTHRTSKKHIDNCRDLGCEEFKLTFPLVESDVSEEEEEVVEEVTHHKVLKLRPKTPSPLAVEVSVSLEA